MADNILVVEDDKDIQEIIVEILRDKGYSVDLADNGREGFTAYQNKEYDLIIMDVMMPEVDGYQIAKLIRNKNKEIPILMLTALEEEYDQLKAFEIGIDDYVTKPFSFNILLKRVEAILRRTKGVSSNSYSKEGLFVDFDGYSVTVDGEEVELTTKEFEILSILIKNKGKVLSREKLLDDIWGYDFYGDTRVIDTHIKNIRRKIKLDFIKTLKGVGYKFED
ncbi:DNA-binding response regulator [endosymbiont 'TC1' of Trimyema compressum]|uniref:response regulator transcription factor n=1 Tax=endosymbiont 'TC1' of Trimyema compressum TaxID=243899 RepID=UPI0007F0C12C|nr:response regulator transcription factor [endosymbiont 'TC1' of Trimyema compressum]AMP19775.1 DNA-binding response regulator [endosymbiont 'TC1' of Trimyema compressum]